MALWSTQSLKEISTRNLPWGGGGVKGGQCIKLKTSAPSLRQLSRKCGNLDGSQPYGASRPVTEVALLLAFIETLKRLKSTLLRCSVMF
jgi:hypothetical protein